MGNCLVTKLKGTVNNPELERIGERRWYVNAAQTSSGSKFVAVSGGSITLISDEGLLVNAQGNHVDSLSSNQDVRWSGATHLRIQNAYDVKEIYYMPIDPRILGIMYNLTKAIFSVIEGSCMTDLAKISNTVTSLSLDSTNKKNFVDYSDDKWDFLRNLTVLTTITIQASATGYAFDITPFGRYLPDSIQNFSIQHIGVTGSLESFVQARRSVVESGSISMYIAANSLIYWKGGATNGNDTLSWTATTITWKGETIDA